MNPDSIDSAENVTSLYIGISTVYVDAESMLNPWQIRIVGGL